MILEWYAKRVVDELIVDAAQAMEAAFELVETEAKARVPVRTGLTQRDIAHQVRMEGRTVIGEVGVRTGKKHAWYAMFVEFGTRHMAARPFLRPALRSCRAQIMRLFGR